MAKNRRSSGVGSSDPSGAAAGLSRSGKPGGVSGRLVNVFEQLWNRRKFDILGRKVKGDVRAKSIGKARSAAVEKRKATLLQEFQQRGKANLFLDRRFGEGDESIPEGEKAIVRFQKERMVRRDMAWHDTAQLSRKNRFSLGDDDESDDDDGEGDDGGGGGAGRRSSRRAAASEDGDLRLTHGGRDIDDFDDSDVSGFGEDEDDDDGTRELVIGVCGLVIRVSVPVTTLFPLDQLIVINSYMCGGDEDDKHARGREIDDFDDSGVSGFSEDEDDDDRALGDQIVSEYHFGGGFVPKAKSATDAHLDAATGQEEGGEERQKTKREVMEEVMAKSKLFKAKRQAEKEEDEHLREQLDAEFRQIAQSDALLALTRAPKGGKGGKGAKGEEKAGGGGGEGGAAGGVSAAASAGGAAGAAKAAAGGSLLAADVAEEEMDDKQYDVLAREMVFDIRAKPGERTKTAEEAAEAERARLVKLETAEEAAEAERGRLVKLEDEEESEEEEGEEKEEGEESDEEEEAEEEKEGEKHNMEERNAAAAATEEQEDEEEEDEEEDEEEEEEENERIERVFRRRELPYVIEAPQQLKDLQRLLEGRAAAEVGVAIARIRACNAAHLSPDNKRKMQIFYNVLLQYFASLASDSGGGGVSQRVEEEDQPGKKQKQQHEQQQKQQGSRQQVKPQGGRKVEEGKQEDKEVEEEEEATSELQKRAPSVAAAHINALVQPLVELSASFPLFAAVCARERLARMQKRLVARLKAGGTPLVELSASFSLFAAVCTRERLARMQKRLVARLKAGEPAWPTARTLLLLRLWALIFPSSDFRHPVMTPVSLLLGQFLSCCPVRSTKDVAAGLFISALLLNFLSCCPVRSTKDVAAGLFISALLLNVSVTLTCILKFLRAALISLLLGQFLSCCPVRSTKDVAAGLFISALLLNMVSQSRRFVPEALNFLHALLWSAVAPALKPVKPKGVPRYMLLQVCSQQWLWAPCGDGSNHRKRKREPLEDKPEALDFDRIFLGPSCPSSTSGTTETTTSTTANPFVSKASPSASPAAPPTLLGVEGSAAGTVAEAYFGSDVFRLSLLLAVLKTLRSFALLYRPMQPFPEIFAPFLPTLAALAESGQLPEEIEQERAAWVKDIEGAVAEVEGSRQPLRLRVKRAVPAKQFNPKFESDFARGKDYDPNRERAEQRRLQRAIKREARGAARELRKDNQFLAAARANEAANALEERREKNQRAMAFMEQQAHLMWSGQLGRKRGGMSSGKGRR
ncbi:unnamed protein product [Closterium sp. NIES-65]|nr:unnamed protein product [Closterium sp. NIES-65]